MAIQNRRGVYNDFAPSKMVPGEFAVVQSGDPNGTSGEAVYIAFTAGNVKRLATYEDIASDIEEATSEIAESLVSQIEADVADDLEAAQQAASDASDYKDAASDSASAASTSATNAANAVKNSVAPAFSTSTAYAIGDYVVYENQLYRFTSAHSAGAWNSSHVTATTVSEDLEDFNDELSNTKADLDYEIEGINKGISYIGGEFVRGTVYANGNLGQGQYRVRNATSVYTDKDIVLTPKTGFRFVVNYYSNASAPSSSNFVEVTAWQTGIYTIPAQSYFVIVIGRIEEDLEEVADLLWRFNVSYPTPIIETTVKEFDNKIADVKESTDAIGVDAHVIENLTGSGEKIFNAYSQVIEDFVIQISPTQESGTPSTSNPKPITGLTQENISVGEGSNVNPTVYNVPFPTGVTTVYSAIVDVANGVFTIDKNGVDLGNLTWTYSSYGSGTFRSTGIKNYTRKPKDNGTKLEGCLCSVYEVTRAQNVSAGTTGIAVNVDGNIWVHDSSFNGNVESFKTAMSGQIFVYPLLESQENTFQPIEVELYDGINYLWLTGGTINKLLYHTDIDNHILSIAPNWLDGKKIVMMGDSTYAITGDKNQHIADYLASIGRCTVYNCSFGGTRMSETRQSTYTPFDFPALVDAIVSGDFTDQDANLSDKATHFAQNLTVLKGVDFSEIDILCIEYGANDFTGNVALGNGAIARDTYTGALLYGVEGIMTEYPNIMIVVESPRYRCWIDEENNNAFVDDVYTKENNLNLKTSDYVSALDQTSAKVGLPFNDNLNHYGWNRYNRLNFFDADDGAHFNVNGTKYAAKALYANLIQLGIAQKIDSVL